MTKKKQRRKLGKEIRQKTGLPLPICMQAAKLIHRGRGREMIFGDLPLFQKIVEVKVFPCGAGCCGDCSWLLKGPKGAFDFFCT